MGSDATGIAVVVVASLIVLTATWSDLSNLVRAVRRRSRARHTPVVKPILLPPVEPRPVTLEGILARQVMLGEITPVQYQQAMSVFAALEARHRPMHIPPDLTAQ